MISTGSLAELKAHAARWRAAGERIALVPTMGALHRGHLALVEAARLGARRVVASIFVNPTQFGPNEDFGRYPRSLERDLAALAGLGVDLVWAPEVATMYPDGFGTSVSVPGLSSVLCGVYRPGHFEGVATVVTKLVNQVGADVAIFGEKDFQQLQVIRRATADLNVPVEIRGLETIREADGLALSSRNQYLSNDERARAPVLNRALRTVAASIRGGAPFARALETARTELSAAGFDPVQYVEIREAESLAPASDLSRPCRVFAAAYLGRTRLIDNLPV